MPVVGFTDHTSGERVTFDEAPDHFEDAGIMPAEAVETMVRDVASRAGDDPRFLTPSGLNPDTLCRREVVIHRFIDYDLDPLIMWDALEGTVWHEQFARMGREGWHAEVRLPDGTCGSTSPDDATIIGDDGHMRVQVCPGLWLRGTADSLPKDGEMVLRDFKTTKWPRTYPRNGDVPKNDYAESQAKDWSIQGSAYAHMIEMSMGKPVKAIWFWRIYRGSRNRAFTFRKIPVPKLTREALWERLEPTLRPLLDWLEEAYQIRERHREAGTDATVDLWALVDRVPPDGKDRAMFNDTKCSKYCGVRHLCPAFKGELEF